MAMKLTNIIIVTEGGKGKADHSVVADVLNTPGRVEARLFPSKVCRVASTDTGGGHLYLAFHNKAFHVVHASSLHMLLHFPIASQQLSQREVGPAVLTKTHACKMVSE
ncbi:hypothetical protein PG997_010736 [Apiospora hydei]|uniref:Uncharacterized protein n=1 Tax=Apiospora hydei TaxID=1337664 RepID=A0ABR1VKZ1_9PEZI